MLKKQGIPIDHCKSPFHQQTDPGKDFYNIW